MISIFIHCLHAYSHLSHDASPHYISTLPAHQPPQIFPRPLQVLFPPLLSSLPQNVRANVRLHSLHLRPLRHVTPSRRYERGANADEGDLGWIVVEYEIRFCFVDIFRHRFSIFVRSSILSILLILSILSILSSNSSSLLLSFYSFSALPL